MVAPEQMYGVFSRTCKSGFGNWEDSVSFPEIEGAGGGAGAGIMFIWRHVECEVLMGHPRRKVQWIVEYRP